MINILLLCTGNSCRSIMAEALFNEYADGKVQAFSAGSFPTGTVNPLSLATLSKNGIKTDGYRSKSWDEFNTIPIDILITVCDNAASEVCPYFSRETIKTHWGVEDPATFRGTTEEIEAEFQRIYLMLKKRVEAFLKLQIEEMSKESLEKNLNTIGLI